MEFIVECPWEWSANFVLAKYILCLKALWKESQRVPVASLTFNLPTHGEVAVLMTTFCHCVSTNWWKDISSRRLCVNLPVISSLYSCKLLSNIVQQTTSLLFPSPSLSHVIGWWNDSMLISAISGMLHPMPAALLQCADTYTQCWSTENQFRLAPIIPWMY